jgi:hypothetical protein
MKKTVVLFIVAAIMTISFQSAFAEEVTDIGNKVFKVYVDAIEISSSFPAYPDNKPPFLDKKTVALKAQAGNDLIKLKIIIDNVSDTKQPFKIEDIQIMSGSKKFFFAAAGLSDHPLLAKSADYNKYASAIKMVESRKDTTGGSYRFPIYVLEVPKNTDNLMISFKGGKWFKLKEIKLNNG